MRINIRSAANLIDNEHRDQDGKEEEQKRRQRTFPTLFFVWQRTTYLIRSAATKMNPSFPQVPQLSRSLHWAERLPTSKCVMIQEHRTMETRYYYLGAEIRKDSLGLEKGKGKWKRKEKVKIVCCYSNTVANTSCHPSLRIHHDGKNNNQLRHSIGRAMNLVNYFSILYLCFLRLSCLVVCECFWQVCGRKIKIKWTQLMYCEHSQFAELLDIFFVLTSLLSRGLNGRQSGRPTPNHQINQKEKEKRKKPHIVRDLELCGE